MFILSTFVQGATPYTKQMFTDLYNYEVGERLDAAFAHHKNICKQAYKVTFENWENKWIKESNPTHKYIFVVTTKQKPFMEDYIKRLPVNLLYRSEKASININYPDEGPKLWVYILQYPTGEAND